MGGHDLDEEVLLAKGYGEEEKWERDIRCVVVWEVGWSSIWSQGTKVSVGREMESLIWFPYLKPTNQRHGTHHA